jgi:hypothetical protein
VSWRFPQRIRGSNREVEQAGAEGAPYLKAVQAIPVFSSLAIGEDAEDAGARDGERGGETAPAQPMEVINVRGRCPFAA